MKSLNEKGFSLVALFMLLAAIIAGLIALSLIREKTPDGSELEGLRPSKTSNDEIVSTNLYKLHGRIMAYQINTGMYPNHSPQVWEGIVGGEEPIVDPYTNAQYVISEDDPAFGQIQYRDILHLVMRMG